MAMLGNRYFEVRPELGLDPNYFFPIFDNPDHIVTLYVPDSEII